MVVPFWIGLWLWSIQTPVLFLWERMYDSRIDKYET